MQGKDSFSILFPYFEDTKYKQLSEITCHDLGLDVLRDELTRDAKERNMIMNNLRNITADQRVATYRQKVFVDILNNPELRRQMLELFDKIEYIRTFGIMHKQPDEKLGLWILLHRLSEIDDYIKCVETMKDCLEKADIHSDGLLGFKKYIEELYNCAYFEEMKKDIAALKSKTSNIQSVTLGINVNERFEAVSMGLVSINDKPFKKSGILSNFADALSQKERIHKGTDWDGSMHFHPVEKDTSAETEDALLKFGSMMALQSTPLVDGTTRATIVNSVAGDDTGASTYYLDRILNKMLESLVKNLRDTLTKYANIAIVNISKIIPEFIYYIRFAEFISQKMEKGFPFCEAQVSKEDEKSMDAKGFYNLKLALRMPNQSEIVYNDLGFDTEHTVYILTGANRGGKTTVTQAIGLMFVLAQGGIFVPAASFTYKPVDCVYTHFPADEDKTVDLGRLGEECVRFKDIYANCTSDSLALLNETFSTTSFEEGYYIARDSVKALMKKQVRTIYNTHMHKLAADLAEINEGSQAVKASSLIVKSDDGKRSFKVEVALPEGMSYARDIAKKYGVTYEMLTGEEK